MTRPRVDGGGFEGDAAGVADDGPAAAAASAGPGFAQAVVALLITFHAVWRKEQGC